MSMTAGARAPPFLLLRFTFYVLRFALLYLFWEVTMDGLSIYSARCVLIEENNYWKNIAKRHLPASPLATGVRMLFAIHEVDGQLVTTDSRIAAHRHLLFAEIYAMAYYVRHNDEGDICEVNLASHHSLVGQVDDSGEDLEFVLHKGDFVTFTGELRRKQLKNGSYLRLPSGDTLFNVGKARLHAALPVNA